MGGRRFQNREKLGQRHRGGVGGNMQGMEVPAMTGARCGGNNRW